MTKKFPEGVEIHLPDKYKHLTVRRFPKGKLPNGVSGRIVMNFDFYNPTSKKKHKKKFTKAVAMLVRYKKKDEIRANGFENLILKYKAGHGWKDFKPFKIISHGKNFGGVGIVEFTDWDPAVGWFP
jgi:hypothetical protein